MNHLVIKDMNSYNTEIRQEKMNLLELDPQVMGVFHVSYLGFSAKWRLAGITLMHGKLEAMVPKL